MRNILAGSMRNWSSSTTNPTATIEEMLSGRYHILFRKTG
jgi:hypothetical protein